VRAEAADVDLGVEVAAGVGAQLEPPRHQKLDELSHRLLDLIRIFRTVHLGGEVSAKSFPGSLVGFKVQAALGAQALDSPVRGRVHAKPYQHPDFLNGFQRRVEPPETACAEVADQHVEILDIVERLDKAVVESFVRLIGEKS
jgi:hypothetical protein